jgi:hypothetical protein
MRTWVEVLLLVALGFGIGYLLFANPPVPPAGICDAEGTAEECVQWWHDVMERP